MVDHDDALKGAFISYVQKVAAHARIDYLRKAKRIEDHEILVDDIQLLSNRVQNAVDVQDELFENCDLLNAFEHLLSESERLTLHYLIVMEKSIREVARCMGISERWVRVLKNRAVKKLREALLNGETLT
jgi:RNA polymerase sigma factor (sigma-70 family)